MDRAQRLSYDRAAAKRLLRWVRADGSGLRAVGREPDGHSPAYDCRLWRSVIAPQKNVAKMSRPSAPGPSLPSSALRDAAFLRVSVGVRVLCCVILNKLGVSRAWPRGERGAFCTSHPATGRCISRYTINYRQGITHTQGGGAGCGRADGRGAPRQGARRRRMRMPRHSRSVRRWVRSTRAGAMAHGVPRSRPSRVRPLRTPSCAA